MIELNTIENRTTWNDASEKLNDNFRKIGVALENNSGGGSSEESIISSGEGESSIMLKNSESAVKGDFSSALGKMNSVYSKYSTAEGVNNEIQLFGVYFYGIDVANKKIYLTSNKAERGLYNFTESGAIPNVTFSIGDTISIVTDLRYENHAKITFIDNNVLFVDNLNIEIDNVQTPEGLDGLDFFSIYSLNNPSAGIVDFALSSHVEGGSNYVKSRDSHAEGYGNETWGLGSHAEGMYNVAEGSKSHVEGENNIARGTASHAEGKDTVASGLRAHAEGESTEASNRASHAEGLGTVTNGVAEHAEGMYNVSHTTTISSIGIGASDGNRKNAIEVLKDGNVFLMGVGGYDGTNPSTSKDIKTVISEKQDKSTIAKVATTGSYNDLNDKPTIPDTSNFLPISGGTLTGQLKAQSIVPTADSSFSIGTSSLNYSAIYAKRILTQQILNSTATGEYSVAIGNAAKTRGEHSFSIGYNATCGQTTGDETLPYIKYASITPNKVIYEGVEYNGIYVPANTTITYQYNGIEYTHTNTKTSIPELLVVITNNETYNLAIESLCWGVLENYGPVIVESRITTVTQLNEENFAISIRGYDRNNVQAWLSTPLRVYVQTKVSSTDYNGDFSLALGYCSLTTAKEATTIGSSSCAFGNRSFAMGYMCNSLGGNSFAMGSGCITDGYYAIAIGREVTTLGSNSVAIGAFSTVVNSNAVAIGYYLTTGANHQVVFGKFNEAKSTNAFELGWGTAGNNKVNIFEVTTSGNATTKGTITSTKHITVGGTSAQFVKGDGSLDSNEYALKSEVVQLIAVADTNDYNDVF